MEHVVEVAVEAVQVPPAGLEVTVYPVIAEPPFTGSTQVTATLLVLLEFGAAVTDDGAPGVPTVIELDGVDAGPEPFALAATTVKV
jgi:hypothetical protein